MLTSEKLTSLDTWSHSKPPSNLYFPTVASNAGHLFTTFKKEINKKAKRNEVLKADFHRNPKEEKWVQTVCGLNTLDMPEVRVEAGVWWRETARTTQADVLLRMRWLCLCLFCVPRTEHRRGQLWVHFLLFWRFGSLKYRDLTPREMESEKEGVEEKKRREPSNSFHQNCSYSL